MSRAPAKIDVRKNGRVALTALFGVLVMTGLAFASVPLYRAFCQATGFGGTVQRASTAPAVVTDRFITIRFDANTSSKLHWKFTSSQTTMRVKIGEQATAHYRAENISAEENSGTAVFNVSPDEAGAYFNKLQCFCFTEQALKPGATVDMPVVFFVDPAILKDAEARNISEITLSYTFYPTQAKQAAQDKLSN